MIKSMTGYGRATGSFDGMDITLELKSVNHRYFEFSSRVPRNFGFLDEKLKSFFTVVIGKIHPYKFVRMERAETHVSAAETLRDSGRLFIPCTDHHKLERIAQDTLSVNRYKHGIIAVLIAYICTGGT